MRRLAYSLGAAIAALSLAASGAEAATYINYGPVGSDGGFTITFGNTGITDASFSDVFNFSMPTGRGDFVITSTMSTGSQNITWTSVAFNGEEFETGTAGWNEFRFLNGLELTAGAAQQLVLSGLGGGNASYSGVITFVPTAAVPEPASWALMIAGFGGAGAMIRRRRADSLPAAA
ncbi:MULTISPECIES: FxDxF family PEP-CTERM protein [unclassified Phenylobacterium]|uniref:FxDxF family PEP-CTERM protein n=1 Tax=unclassified Phenylobacterium TaxID=2640670 RepID=UPI0009EAC1E8|nr:MULTISPECIES: FxDxF family PEP-CTERM protein [unclassified Phenylobacterium]